MFRFSKLLALMSTLFAASCEKQFCLVQSSAPIESNWHHPNRDDIKKLQGGSLFFLQEPSKIGHLRVEVTTNNSCKGRTASAGELDEIPTQLPFEDSKRACRMDYKLKDGKWSKLLQYEQLLVRTGMEPQLYSGQRQPQKGPEITLDIMAYGTCRDLEAAVKMVLDGEVVAANELQFAE